MVEKAKLFCPNCGHPVLEPMDECVECQLHLDRLDSIAGTVPRHDSFVTDYQEAMSFGAAKRLSGHLFMLGKRFPQATFSVFFFPPPPRIPHKLYAFWLANRGRFSPLTARSEKNYSVLLLVDCDRGQAVLNVGYGVETILDEDTLAECLMKAKPAFDRGKYDSGVRACFASVSHKLMVAARADGIDHPAPQHGSNQTAEAF
jgi:hypothetical protein